MVLMKIVIREMKNKDFNKVTNIGKAELKSSAKEIRDGISATTDYPTAKAFVALKGGTIIGFVTVWWEAQACKIGYIAVKKSEQNKGMGAAITKHIEDFCKRKRLRMLHTSTQPNNKNAIEFYMANGFRRTGYRKDVFERGIDEIYFTKYIK